MKTKIINTIILLSLLEIDIRIGKNIKDFLSSRYYLRLYYKLYGNRSLNKLSVIVRNSEEMDRIYVYSDFLDIEN